MRGHNSSSRLGGGWPFPQVYMHQMSIEFNNNNRGRQCKNSVHLYEVQKADSTDDAVKLSYYVNQFRGPMKNSLVPFDFNYFLFYLRP